MSTGFANANGIEICYETFGDPADPALLLEMGLGGQMVEWEPEFCEKFAREGFYVIRYDRRDTGLSTKFEGTPDLPAVFRGDGSSAVYTLFDMADDAVGLLDALGVERAHVLGASMGGMVVQAELIRHPERFLSACVIMSTTGAQGVGKPKPEAFAALVGPKPTARDEVIEAAVATSRAMAGSGFPFDEDKVRRRSARTYDRMYFPAGRERHMAAISATGDRTEALRAVRVPTVVVHGADDPLVTLSGGEAIAAAIPDSTLVVIPGMGHEFPDGAQPLVVKAFVENARRAVS